ncbi:hypothetical protein A471_06186 [Ectopseudomonas mendocina DLHK]|nr:hypothetical protein A471_06186 [Pseudomonas mendocina DLHK]
MVSSRFGTFRILHLAGEVIGITGDPVENIVRRDPHLIAGEKMHFQCAGFLVFGDLHYYSMAGVISRVFFVVIWIERTILIALKRYGRARIWIFLPLHNGS